MAQHDLPSAARRFWQRTHAPDYLTLIALAVGYLLIQTLITPFHRLFSPTNLSISFPHAEVERVPVAFLFVYAGALPLAILAAWALILRPGAHKAHVTILGLLMSLVLTSFLTDVFKNAVGRPRPDLLARCMVRAGWDKEPGHPVLVGVEVCTQTNHHKLQDGWRSFPSGHSSFAFAGLGYMAMFFAGQLHVFRPQPDLARVLVALAPLVGAALIAISRCEDYRHDVYDVTVGSLLGFFVAHFVYRKYYPPLRAARCDVPYPPKSEDNNGYGKLRDEEQGRSPRRAERDRDGERDGDRAPLREASLERGRGDV